MRRPEVRLSGHQGYGLDGRDAADMGGLPGVQEAPAAGGSVKHPEVCLSGHQGYGLADRTEAYFESRSTEVSKDVSPGPQEPPSAGGSAEAAEEVPQAGRGRAVERAGSEDTRPSKARRMEESQAVGEVSEMPNREAMSSSGECAQMAAITSGPGAGTSELEEPPAKHLKVDSEATSQADQSMLSRVIQLNHQPMLTGTYMWCTKCGSHGERHVLKLLEVCPGMPRNSSAADRRGRLQKGKHPITRAYIGAPTRPTAAQLREAVG